MVLRPSGPIGIWPDLALPVDLQTRAVRTLNKKFPDKGSQEEST